MTDTITLPSGVEVMDGKVLVIPGIGVVLPVGDLTPADVQELRDEVAAVLGLRLADLPDVDLAGLADGNYLRWDAASSTFKAVALTNGIRVRDTAAVILSENAADLTFRAGLTATQTGTRTYVSPVFGASGTAAVVARSDHAHPPTLIGRLDFDKAGAVLGAGTSDLVNTSVSGLIPGVVYDVAIDGVLEAVNTNLSGRLRLHCQIGSTGTTQTLSRGFSGGVWSTVVTKGTRMGVGAVSTLALRFWVEYLSGDPTTLYTGYLAYSITPRGGTA